MNITDVNVDIIASALLGMIGGAIVTLVTQHVSRQYMKQDRLRRLYSEWIVAAQFLLDLCNKLCDSRWETYEFPSGEEDRAFQLAIKHLDTPSVQLAFYDNNPERAKLRGEFREGCQECMRQISSDGRAGKRAHEKGVQVAFGAYDKMKASLQNLAHRSVKNKIQLRELASIRTDIDRS